MTKQEIIALAMESFGWKEAKCLSWFKLENKLLGGNSPFELMQRGETDKVVQFLKRKRAERTRDDPEET